MQSWAVRCGRERMRSSAKARLPRCGNQVSRPRAMSWQRSRNLATCDRARPRGSRDAAGSRLRRSRRPGGRFAASSGAHAPAPSRTQPLAARAKPVSTRRLGRARSGGRPGLRAERRDARLWRGGGAVWVGSEAPAFMSAGASGRCLKGVTPAPRRARLLSAGAEGRGRCDRALGECVGLVVLGGGSCSAWYRAGVRLVLGSACGPDQQRGAACGCQEAEE
jgi:hypothetical protein